MQTVRPRPPLRTMNRAFQNICTGEGPWIALGNFLNYWFVDAKDHRYDLVSDPLPEVPANEYCQHWAAYCAASVEDLCAKYSQEPLAKAEGLAKRLAQRKFLSSGFQLKQQRDGLQECPNATLVRTSSCHAEAEAHRVYACPATTKGHIT